MPPASQPTVNPYTGRGYSQKYFDILAKRKGKTLIDWSPQYLPSDDLRLLLRHKRRFAGSCSGGHQYSRATHTTGFCSCHKQLQHADATSRHCCNVVTACGSMQAFQYGRHARSLCR